MLYNDTMHSMEFNGLHVFTKEWVMNHDSENFKKLLVTGRNGHWTVVCHITFCCVNSIDPIKYNNYHEIATIKNFRESLLESKEIDFKASSLCFQQKLRIRFKGLDFVVFQFFFNWAGILNFLYNVSFKIWKGFRWSRQI